jgi:hypothetical protein
MEVDPTLPRFGTDRLPPRLRDPQQDLGRENCMELKNASLQSG